MTVSTKGARHFHDVGSEKYISCKFKQIEESSEASSWTDRFSVRNLIKFTTQISIRERYTTQKWIFIVRSCPKWDHWVSQYPLSRERSFFLHILCSKIYTVYIYVCGCSRDAFIKNKCDLISLVSSARYFVISCPFLNLIKIVDFNTICSGLILQWKGFYKFYNVCPISSLLSRL